MNRLIIFTALLGLLSSCGEPPAVDSPAEPQVTEDEVVAECLPEDFDRQGCEKFVEEHPERLEEYIEARPEEFQLAN